MTNIQNKIQSELDKLKKNIQKPNILLVGGTGVGKSTLLNLCFGKDIAKTGIGQPITNSIEKYNDEDLPISIFDSKGYEIGSEKEHKFIEEIITLCQVTSNNIENKPHLVWYCISAINARLTDFDIQTIKTIQKTNVPIAIILTKSDLINDKEGTDLKNTILKEFSTIHIFETTTHTELKHMDLEKLVLWSIQQLPEALKLAFVSAQILNIEEKRQQAQKIILQHTAGSAFVGFSPIPFSDAPILLANQYALLARILYLYNLGGLESKFSLLIKALLPSLLSTSGRLIVGEMLKFIPGVGSITGAMISGTVASSITGVFGFAVSKTCAILAEKQLSGALNEMQDFMDNFDENFIAIFQQTLTAKKK